MWVIGEIALALGFVAGVVLVEALSAPSLRRLRLPTALVMLACPAVVGVLLLA